MATYITKRRQSLSCLARSFSDIPAMKKSSAEKFRWQNSFSDKCDKILCLEHSWLRSEFYQQWSLSTSFLLCLPPFLLVLVKITITNRLVLQWRLPTDRKGWQIVMYRNGLWKGMTFASARKTTVSNAAHSKWKIASLSLRAKILTKRSRRKLAKWGDSSTFKKKHLTFVS